MPPTFRLQLPTSVHTSWKLVYAQRPAQGLVSKVILNLFNLAIKVNHHEPLGAVETKLIGPETLEKCGEWASHP